MPATTSATPARAEAHPAEAHPAEAHLAEAQPAEAVRWLDAEEMAAWLPLMRVLHLLPQQLDRQLREQAGINHNYYMIMVALSAQADHEMTLSRLAHEVAMIPSRLTHALTSLEGRGWVERRPCSTDKRVQLAWLTDDGMRALEHFAPGHVGEVRRTVFDALEREDLAHLRRITGKLAAGLGDHPNPPGPSRSH